jgi:hypothetical protein
MNANTNQEASAAKAAPKTKTPFDIWSALQKIDTDLHELRWALHYSKLNRCEVESIMNCLNSIAAQVRESKRNAQEALKGGAQ